MIAVHDTADAALRVIHCDDTACLGGSEQSTLLDDDPSEVRGVQPSIAIGSNQFPIISQRTGGTGVRLTKCDDAACSTAATTSIDDAGIPVGSETSIAVRTNGQAIAVVQGLFNGNTSLRRLLCVNLTCASGVNGGSISASNTLGTAPAMTIGVDGFPVIVHGDSATNSPVVTHCDDPVCNKRERDDQHPRQRCGHRRIRHHGRHRRPAWQGQGPQHERRHSCSGACHGLLGRPQLRRGVLRRRLRSRRSSP